MKKLIQFIGRAIVLFTSKGKLESPATQSPEFLTYAIDFLENEVRERHLSDSTKKKYKTFANNIAAFIRSTHKDRTITIANIDIPLIMQFKTWLHKSLKSCAETNSSKHIETVKRIMDHAVMAGKIPYNPLTSFKTKRDAKKEKIYLQASEIRKIERAKLVCDEYHFVRDLYLFQCYTGLSYIDLWRYEIETNNVEENGLKKKIDLVTSQGGRGKTGRKYWSELSNEAKVIHEKYDGKFPKIDNARYNRYLKELMDHIGIKRYLTTHTGRKTFANEKRKDGHSIPEIAVMLGNTEQVCRVDYVDEHKELVLNGILEIRSRKNRDRSAMN